jgi:hypothetical protein
MGVVTVNGAVTVLANTFSGTLVGAASIEAALTDASDASYVEVDDAHGGELTLVLPTPTLPAGCIVQGITFEIRRSRPLGSGQLNPFWLWKIIMSKGGAFNVPLTTHGRTYDGTFTTAIPWTSYSIENSGTGFHVDFPGGEHVATMNRDGVILSLGFIPLGGPPGVRLYRLRTNWWYNEVPAVTVTAPPDPATTSRPSVTWTYSDPEGNPQRSWRAMIIEDGSTSGLWPYGYAGSAGFNPEGVWGRPADSGVQYGAFTSWPVPVGLRNGHTYWAYVRAYSDPVAGLEQASAWTAKRFTVSVTGPPDPAVNVTADSTLSRVRIEGTESTVVSPNPSHYDVERSEDGGATWTLVRGGDFTGVTRGFYVPGGTAGWDTPDRAELSVSNGIRVRWRGTLPDYTPAADMVLAGQSRSASRGWKVSVRSDGKLELQWSTTGASWNKTATSTVSAGLSNGQEAWIEVEAVFSTNPWSVIFRVSTDGTNWTAVGATVTAAGPATVNNTTSPLEVAGADSHTVSQLTGTTRRVSVWNAANQLAVDGNWDGLAPDTTTFVDLVGATWTHTGTVDHLVTVIDLYDYEATLGVSLTYRARAYRTFVDGYAASDWVQDAPVTLSPGRWWIKDPLNPDVNMPVSMVEWSRSAPKPMTVDDGIDSTTAIVVHGGVRSERIQATIRTLDKASYDKLVALLKGGRTLLVQGVLGAQWYVQPGDIQFDIIHASPVAGEGFPIRHAHEIGVPFVEVEAP